MRDKSSTVTMNRLSISQITASLAMLLLGTGGALMMGAHPISIALPVLAGVLVLIITSGDAGLRPAEPPAPVVPDQPDFTAHPDFPSLLEGISDPPMLVEKGRIVRANRAAMRLLGAHIEGEDARIAIRHPAAAERLASLAPLAEPIMIELVGLGTREQRWQMRVAPVGAVNMMRRLVHLVDAIPVDVVFPAVVDAAQPAFLVAAQPHGGQAVGAEFGNQPDPSFGVPEGNQFLAHQLDSYRRAVRLRNLEGQ